MPMNFISRHAPRVVACAALSVAFLSGCATTDPDKPTPEEFEPQAFRPLTEAFDKLGYRWDWSGFPTPASGERIVFLEAWPDAVATQDSASKVTIIEPASGRVRWSGEVASRFTRFVGLSRDREGKTDRMISSSESEAFVLDMQTGNLVSRERFENVVNTPPLLLGPIGVYGTPNGELLAHRYSNSTRAWAYQASGPVEFPPILAGHIIAGITQAGIISMIDAYSGSLAARARIYGGAAGTLATDGALIFVASLDQSIYAFDAITAQKVWQHRTSQPLSWSPVCIGARLYCHTADLGLTCFDAGTGRVIWNNENVRGSVIGTRKNDLLVWNGTEMVLLEPDQGATVARAALPNIRKVTFDRFDDGNLYITNRAGVVGRFVPKK